MSSHGPPLRHIVLFRPGKYGNDARSCWRGRRHGVRRGDGVLSRRSDLVALSLGCFLACIAAQLLLGGASGRWLALASLPFFTAFVAELRPGKWPHRVAAAIAIAGVLSGIAGALALTQALACGVAVWAIFVSLRLVRERRNTWPVVIIVMAITYPVLTLGLLGLEGFEPAGFIAYVVAPGVILTRRAIRAFDAEARRALDQAKFATDVFDSVPVALSMRGLDGRYVFVNRTWEKYYGHERDNVSAPAARPRHAAEADALLASTRRDRGGRQPAAAGGLHARRRRYLQTRTAMVDSQGKLLGVLTASIDTSDRRRWSRRWRWSSSASRWWCTPSSACSTGTARRAAPTTRRASRRSSATSPTPTPPAGPTTSAAASRGRDACAGSAAHRQQQEDFHEPLDYRLRRADGSYIWVQAQGISVRDAKGYATRFIATLTDITRGARRRRRCARACLREEVERMSRHDLKTPLNSVIAVSRLLRQSAKLSREDEELLSIVERAGYRILSMVNLSLDIFKMEQGTYQFRAQAVDLSEVAPSRRRPREPGGSRTW